MNIIGRNKVTALISSAYSFDGKCAKLLLEAGADINSADMNGDHSTYYSCMAGLQSHAEPATSGRS